MSSTSDASHEAQQQTPEGREQARTAQAIAQELCTGENSELWRQWAQAKLQAGEPAEAEAGLECALRLDPGNRAAAIELASLLDAAQRPITANAVHQRAGLPAATPFPAQPSSDELAACLRRFVRWEENEEDYFRTHLARYLSTLEMVPAGDASQALLELGAAFHHITPALQKFFGYGSIHCADVWDGEPLTVRSVKSLDGSEEYRFPVHNFDIESAPWPYQAEQFDTVLCCEMLEHLMLDPMLVLAEINRVLKTGGQLLLTTPNIASGKGVRSLFQGESPYVWGQFEPHGRPTDRHNREYSTAEVLRLLWFAGFEAETVATPTFYWPVETSLFARLAALDLPIAHRGDDTMVRARKRSAVQERYPAEFYATHGTQQARRETELATVVPAMRPLRLLVVHEILPEHDRTGCDQRLMQVLTELRSLGHEVTYVARSGQNRERYQPDLEALGIRVFAHDSERMQFLGMDQREPKWRFEEVLRDGNFDAAILYHWYWNAISIPEHYLFAIRKHSPNTRILVLTDDQHGLRERRLAELSQSIPDFERSEDFLQREVEVYREADMVLMVSEEDRKGLLQRFPSMKTEILPNDAESLSGAGSKAVPAPFGERTNILFLGNFDNLANRDALQWFLDGVWPLIRAELPDVNLVLAGNNMPEAYRNLADDIVALGYVDDLGELFARHRVFAAPVRYGTGTKTKNLNSLSHGLPIVTTAVGAEGLNLTHGTNALLAEAEADFAAEVVRLYRDEQLWNGLSRQGQAHIHATFGRERLRNQIETIVTQTRMLHPRPYRSGQQFSFLRVEDAYPEILTREPAWERTEIRLLGYVKLAEQRLQEGNAGEALEQLRHIFTFVRGDLPQNVFMLRVLETLERAYGALGQADRQARYAEAQKTLFLPHKSSPAAHRPDCPPKISVIIPTRNRWQTLARCLRALSEQTLPLEEFEVILIDDGSTDETAEFCSQLTTFPHFQYIHQDNAGIGAARHSGVEAARADYLLLINDDSIAANDLLERHLATHQRFADPHLAVLGNFRYPAGVRHRALPFFLATQPVMFPQVAMNEGFYDKNAYYITCNLSLRRDEVLAAGNFDPAFRVSEDTELGVRLRQRGGRLFYEPRCLAVHDHAHYTLADWVNRSRRYGASQCQMILKHPHLLRDQGVWPAPLLTTGNISDIDAYMEGKEKEVAAAVASLERFDSIEFEPFLSMQEGTVTMADKILIAFSQLIPIISDYYLAEGFRDACKGRGMTRLDVATMGAHAR